MNPTPPRPWPPGAATGLGSLPGTDPAEAVQLVLGEVADLPYLPELPARGLGADMVGRTASLLVDLATEWQPHGWTVASRAGRDLRQARDFLTRDLDAITEQGQGIEVFKVQICGPLTLGASIELPNLHKVLTDHGAFADLAASLAEGARLHVDELRRRLPGTRIVLQVDEPSMPAVLTGRVPTPSGYGTVRSLDRTVAVATLESVLAAADDGYRVVHCCAPEVDLTVLGDAGANAVAIDAALVTSAELDSIGELIESGTSIWLGVAPATDTAISLDSLRGQLDRFWQHLGFNRDSLALTVVPTPACGMAGASPDYARRVMSLLRDVGQSLQS
ncbi:MAG TPA: methionine synthase [Jatrophihabitans sp.]